MKQEPWVDQGMPSSQYQSELLNLASYEIHIRIQEPLRHVMNVAGTSRESMDSGEIDKLAESLEGKLTILRSFSAQCSIYRVPKRLRELNEKAYTPRVISIGPLHYGKEELKEMEEHKRLYLREFLDQSEVSMKDFIAATINRETSVRNCYAETFDKLSRKEFVEMVLLDCSFLIMLLLKSHSPDFHRSNDLIHKPWMINEIMFDLCLLENQLPFFIVEDLFKLSKILHHREECSMIKLTQSLFSLVWDSWVPKNILELNNLSKVEHFVDFLRICQQPTQQVRPQKTPTRTTQSVAKLHQAGIKFKSVSNRNLMDIRFNKGTLEIPRFTIDDRTEMLYRNLQAFEQCTPSCSGHVGDYIFMLSFLVVSSKDVEILVKNEILENMLSDDDAISRLVQNLAKENFVSEENLYFSVIENLNKYSKKRTPKWKAALKQKYFQNPWTIISVVAAAVLLILTIIQTVCSIIQVIS